jgi:SAM-dependent methyltransferase
MRKNSVTDALVGLGRRVLGTRQLNHLVRFQPVLELICGAHPQGGTLLDVGSGSRGVTTILPAGWRAIALDADFEDYGAVSRPKAPQPGRIIGDVRALPFADRSFDVAVTVDLLEHVPASDRALAVSEVCRVARRRAIFACPTGPNALAADDRLAGRLRTFPRGVPAWLVEHLENGFPEPAELIRVATSFGPVHVLNNEAIAAHHRLVVAENSMIPAAALRLACVPLEAMMRSRRRRIRGLVGRMLWAARGRDRPPTYRTIVAVDLADNSEPGNDPS